MPNPLRSLLPAPRGTPDVAPPAPADPKSRPRYPLILGVAIAVTFALTTVLAAVFHEPSGTAPHVVVPAGLGVLVGALVVALAQQEQRFRVRTLEWQREIAHHEHKHGVVTARTADLEQQVTARTAVLEEQAERMLKLYHMAYDFVGNVSHEFRTPLTVIKEYVAALEEAVADLELDPETRQFFTTIHARLDDLCLMVDDLIDVTRLEADIVRISRRPCRVEDIVARVLDIVTPKARQVDVTVEFMAADSMPDLYCDSEKIGRVLVNLVVNALKFAPHHSTVRVWALYDGDDGLVRIGVTDHGPGIPRDSREMIFERFKQSTHGGTSGGFGLGLHIARELVGLNFGDMSLHSHVGLGSVFSFSVPAWRPVFLLQHYLRHVSSFRQDANLVSLLAVTTGDSAAEQVDASPPHCADALGSFLEERLRRTDLLVRTGPSAWVLLAATAQGSGVQDLLTRLHAEHEQANVVRRHQPLPPLHFETLGTWSTTAGEDLEIAFAAALGRGCRLSSPPSSSPTAGSLSPP